MLIFDWCLRPGTRDYLFRYFDQKNIEAVGKVYFCDRLDPLGLIARRRHFNDERTRIDFKCVSGIAEDNAVLRHSGFGDIAGNRQRCLLRDLFRLLQPAGIFYRYWLSGRFSRSKIFRQDRACNQNAQGDAWKVHDSRPPAFGVPMVPCGLLNSTLYVMPVEETLVSIRRSLVSPSDSTLTM